MGNCAQFKNIVGLKHIQRVLLTDRNIADNFFSDGMKRFVFQS